MDEGEWNADMTDAINLIMSPAPTSSITYPMGFRAAGTTCGIKPSGQPDLAVIVSDRTGPAAGVFTRNRLPGAPVLVSRRHLRRGQARAIVCNSGIANVANGTGGETNALAMCEQMARAVDCSPREVLVCSTGVIGRRLPMTKITRGIASATAGLGRGPTTDAAASHAILTTDLVTKSARERLRVGKSSIRVGGIAKGSGMIAPNMATMLCFITTDAAIEPAPLRTALKEVVDRTFNRMSIDSDTSTSDSVLILASGVAGHASIRGPGRAYRTFVGALERLCERLAEQIVRDGEGATRVIRLRVEQAASERDADRVGRAVVDSPLVKTAVHGSDPNWGRLIMAIGKSGARIQPEKLSIAIGDVTVFHRGAATKLTNQQRTRLGRRMRGPDVALTVHLGLGRYGAQWLGCDLSRQYVTINAEYTT